MVNMPGQFATCLVVQVRIYISPLPRVRLIYIIHETTLAPYLVKIFFKHGPRSGIVIIVSYVYFLNSERQKRLCNVVITELGSDFVLTAYLLPFAIVVAISVSLLMALVVSKTKRIPFYSNIRNKFG